MKKLLLILLYSASTSYAYLSADVTAGQASVEGEPINTLTASAGWYQDKVYGNFGWGAGLRISNYSAAEYQPSSKRSEVLEDVNITSTNLFGQVHYDFNGILLGFNLDLIGITSGDDASIQGSNNPVSPYSSNVFLYGKNDKGSLNSQVFAQYSFGSWYLKGGLAHTVVEYKDIYLVNDERRQRFFDSFFIGLGINL